MCRYMYMYRCIERVQMAEVGNEESLHWLQSCVSVLCDHTNTPCTESNRELRTTEPQTTQLQPIELRALIASVCCDLDPLTDCLTHPDTSVLERRIAQVTCAILRLIPLYEWAEPVMQKQAENLVWTSIMKKLAQEKSLPTSSNLLLQSQTVTHILRALLHILNDLLQDASGLYWNGVTCYVVASLCCQPKLLPDHKDWGVAMHLLLSCPLQYAAYIFCAWETVIDTVPEDRETLSALDKVLLLFPHSIAEQKRTKKMIMTLCDILYHSPQNGEAMAVSLTLAKTFAWTQSHRFSSEDVVTLILYALSLESKDLGGLQDPNILVFLARDLACLCPQQIGVTMQHILDRSDIIPDPTMFLFVRECAAILRHQAKHMCQYVPPIGLSCDDSCNVQVVSTQYVYHLHRVVCHLRGMTLFESQDSILYDPHLDGHQNTHSDLAEEDLALYWVLLWLYNDFGFRLDASASNTCFLLERKQCDLIIGVQPKLYHKVLPFTRSQMHAMLRVAKKLQMDHLAEDLSLVLWRSFCPMWSAMPSQYQEAHTLSPPFDQLQKDRCLATVASLNPDQAVHHDLGLVHAQLLECVNFHL